MSDSTAPTPKNYRYVDAGVSIAAGNDLVKAIAPLAKATRRAGGDVGLGGFGGFFDLKASGYSDPLLVAATDGVGTKLKLAIDSRCHDTVGIDLVAMCANDLLVQGAEPLFFLDYYASGKLDVAVATQVVAGIANGCKQAGCALIGGETAEMPDFYAASDYDLAGFCVGAVERDAIPSAEKVRVGDVILGVASAGLHSNGFSLVRRLAKDKDWRLDESPPFAFGNRTDISLGQLLLEPTRLYVQSLLPLLQAQRINALAHITGGGLLENIPRVLAKGQVAELSADSWQLPALFRFVQAQGAIAPQEMARTFNCGIGMALIVDRAAVAEVTSALEAAGEAVYPIGRIAASSDPDRIGCVLTGGAGSWGTDSDWNATHFTT